MTEDKNYEGIAAYMGVSAPETPKYLLTNNFLLEYFEPSQNADKVYGFEQFVADGVLYTEDAANEELLKKSFDCFMRRYLGEETIREGNHRLRGSKHYYFPLVQEMLTKSTVTLRHMLFHLQALGKSFDYKEMQKNLANYVFNDNSGINHLLKVLFQSEEGHLRYAFRMSEEETKEFWSMLSSTEKGRMEKLGTRLNEDLNVLLTHEYFCKLDFYRRYNYLSILLTSYVIQYIIWRKGANVCILCKGNSQDERLLGMFHKACCNNYIEIRSLFPDLLQRYYSKVIKSYVGDDKEELRLKTEDGNVWIEDKLSNEFIEEVLAGRKMRNKIEYSQIEKAFNLNEVRERMVPINEFVMRYIDMTGTRKGSTLTKISSILPTSGRQIEMIFPNSNARHKYFAMSGSLAEFYVRLYLAGKKQKYDYLDSFIEYLQMRYHIVLVKSAEGDKWLKNFKPKLSARDFAQNKDAFMNTLNNANCLIKLSDSGYVITLPEEKGDLKLI